MDEKPQPEVEECKTRRGAAGVWMGGLYMERMGLLIVFDLRDPEAVRRFYEERAAWREQADIEMLDLDHAVLIVRPGVPEERWAA